MPCARQSLLLGIGGGTAVGAIRFLGSKRAFSTLLQHRTQAETVTFGLGVGTSSNWAVATFGLLSLTSWYAPIKATYDCKQFDQHIQGSLQTFERERKSKDAGCHGRVPLKSQSQGRWTAKGCPSVFEQR